MMLEGKVALVTGGSRGIGAGIAERLGKEGASVVVNYSGSKDKAEEVVEKIRSYGSKAIALKADVSSKAEVDAMYADALKEFGELNILISNAGICEQLPWFDITEEIWDKHFNINMKGTYLNCQAASRIMRDQGKGGSIVGISSISALVGGAMQTPYTPTKAGIKSLMQSLAIALGPYGIRCNSLLPGCILTDINRWQLGEGGANPELRAYFNSRIPTGRVGEPEDLGGIAAFLCSDSASYITGAEILVDGGMYVNLQ